MQRQATFVSSVSQDAHKPRKLQTLSRSHQPAAFAVPVSVKDHLTSSNTMGSTPKRWVMKPLMPKLEKSDLRPMLSPGSESRSPDNSWSQSQDGYSPTFSFDNISVIRTHSSVIVSAPNGERAQDVVVHARQVAVSEESSVSEDWQTSDPSSPSSTGSYAGFYSFVDDPTSPEAVKNEAYMVSPERQAKLSTLKEKSSFKLQTYVEERRPEKLFEDSNGDSRYVVEDVSAEDEEEKLDRQELIRNQAPKKSPVLKEQWSALENLDLSKSPQRLVEGFSLSYSPVSTKSALVEIEPGTIDDQQIDFKAARKQFQMMESSKQNPFRHSPQQGPHSKLRARSLPASAGLFTKEDGNLKDEPDLNQIPWKREEKETKMTVTVYEDPENGVQRSLRGDLDSGPGDQSDGHMSSEPSISEIKDSSPETSETPIEREIRIAREREEDLRRSRGIFRSDSSEMIEIKTKPILSQPSTQLKPIKAKESNRVSFLIQRETDKMNRSQGLHDWENLTDQAERSRTFKSQLDVDPHRSMSADSRLNTELPALVEERDVPDSQETLSPCCPHRHKDEAMIQKDPAVLILDRPVRKGFYTWEEVAERHNNEDKVANQPSWMTAYKVKGPRRTNSLSSPVEPVKTSRSVQRRSHWESSGEWPQRQSASDLIRKEIEEDLRREQELQELRETSNLSLTTDRDKGTPEPTASEPISNNNDQTSLNSSQENLVEVDTELPERSTQRDSYSLSYSWSEDYTPTRVTLAGMTALSAQVQYVTSRVHIG